MGWDSTAPDSAGIEDLEQEFLCSLVILKILYVHLQA